jgi:phosphate starvation-inducible protein PhoH and related proteins
LKRAKNTRREKARAKTPATDVRFDPRFERFESAEVYEKPQVVARLEPKNQNQKVALSYLNADTPIVFLTGSAGTGKSMLAAYRAATQIKAKRVRKVFLVRPAVSVGKSVGMLPGDIKEKLAPYFAQTMAHLEKFLGKGPMTYCLNHDQIEMKPVEYLRGMSFEDCIVIAEEVQNFTTEEMEMMLTRLGENCQIIFTGDTKQHDLKGISGLDSTIKLLDRMLQTHPEYMTEEDMDELDEGIGIVRFKPEDVVRRGLTKAFVKMYYNN